MTKEEWTQYVLDNSSDLLVEIKDKRTGLILKSLPISVTVGLESEVITNVTQAVEGMYE